MTYTHCPHQVPSLDADRGWYCSRSGKCFWPKCDRSDPTGGASHDEKKTDTESFDSAHSDSVSRDSHIERSESNGGKPANSAESFDSAHSARVWQFVGPYKSGGREYFRYQWGIGHEVRETIHIPGGARSNPVARQRARQVWVGIHKQGWTVEQTKAFISPWRGHKARL